MSRRHTEIQPLIWMLIGIYLVSGINSLAYEVLWARMLSLQFGVSIFGVTTTVAAFMGGLGLGSILGLRYLRAHRSPLILFGILELSLAVYALAIPWLFSWSDKLINSGLHESSITVWYSAQLFASLLLLLIPATVMGAGFPVILRCIKNTNISLGKIYGFNTLGGALGALFPLVLLPNLGWLASTQIIAVLSLLIGLFAIWLSTKLGESLPPDRSEIEVSNQKLITLLAYGGIGAAALMLEVGWTRLLGMIFLRTEYVLAIILAVFLLGIGVGSLVAKYLLRPIWFSILPILCATAGIASLWLIPIFSKWIESSQFMSLGSALFWQGSAIALLTLPVTLVLGAWLPLLSHHLGKTAYTGVWLYAVNSVGAAFGALIAGLVLIPLMGTNATICLASFLLFICGVLWSQTPKAWWSMLILIPISLPVFKMSHVSDLLPISQAKTHDLYIHEDAISVTHVIEREDGQRLLLADLQRMDASTDPDAVESQKNQARLPLLLHPNPRSVLFLGLGTGISAAGSLPFPGLKRTAVELSQGAIDAAKSWFSPVNNHIADHLNIVHEDARRFLMRRSEHYDVIIGDLFHPDLVGRSALLSVQQFQRAKDRLSNNGLFVQWVALNQFDVNNLKIVLRTFSQVFPNAVLFVDTFRIALVGPKGKFDGWISMQANLARLSEADRFDATGGEGVWTWLGRFWGPINKYPGHVQDEWAPRIEYQLPAARYNGDLNLAKLLTWLLKDRVNIQQASILLNIKSGDFSAYERAYAATELAQRGWLASLQGRDNEEQRLLSLAYQANPKDRWIGYAIADSMYSSLDAAQQRGIGRRKALEIILRVRPDHPQALHDLWTLSKADGDMSAAAKYKERLQTISPLNIAFRHPG